MHLKLTNGTPATYTLGQLRRDNPNTSFPKVIPDGLLASYDVYPYTRPAVPEYDNLPYEVRDGSFEQVDGEWSLPYIVQQQEGVYVEENIRFRRNNLLKKSDWVALTDNTITTEWAAYRQALRDVTSQVGFPYSVNWPAKPTT